MTPTHTTPFDHVLAAQIDEATEPGPDREAGHLLHAAIKAFQTADPAIWHQAEALKTRLDDLIDARRREDINEGTLNAGIAEAYQTTSVHVWLAMLALNRIASNNLVREDFAN